MPCNEICLDGLFFILEERMVYLSGWLRRHLNCSPAALLTAGGRGGTAATATEAEIDPSPQFAAHFPNFVALGFPQNLAWGGGSF